MPCVQLNAIVAMEICAKNYHSKQKWFQSFQKKFIAFASVSLVSNNYYFSSVASSTCGRITSGRGANNDATLAGLRNQFAQKSFRVFIRSISRTHLVSHSQSCCRCYSYNSYFWRFFFNYFYFQVSEFRMWIVRTNKFALWLYGPVSKRMECVVESDYTNYTYCCE